VQLVIGRIGRAHGTRGDVTVEVRTDDVEYRFAPGAELMTDPPEAGPLRVESHRWHQGRLLLKFADVADRDRAEALRGVYLVVDSATSRPLAEADDFWVHELTGLVVMNKKGQRLGTVEDVVSTAGTDLLVVRRDDGNELLIPFVSQFVPDVDLDARRVVVDPPEGLLDL
jgi:16S rRNA processing protein RimM